MSPRKKLKVTFRTIKYENQQILTLKVWISQSLNQICKPMLRQRIKFIAQVIALSHAFVASLRRVGAQGWKRRGRLARSIVQSPTSVGTLPSRASWPPERRLHRGAGTLRRPWLPWLHHGKRRLPTRRSYAGQLSFLSFNKPRLQTGSITKPGESPIRIVQKNFHRVKH